MLAIKCNVVWFIIFLLPSYFDDYLIVSVKFEINSSVVEMFYLFKVYVLFFMKNGPFVDIQSSLKLGSPISQNLDTNAE